MTKVRRGFPTIVRVLAVFLLFATPAGIGAPAAAAPSADEVQHAKDRVQQLVREVRAARDRLAQISLRVNELAALYEREHGRLEGITADLLATERSLAIARDRYATILARLNARAREAFILGPGSSLEFVLGATSLTDLSDRLAFIDAVAASDAELSQQVQNTKNVLSAKEADLERLRARQQEVVARVRAREQEIRDAFEEQRSLVDDIARKKAEAARYARKLSTQRQQWLRAQFQGGGPHASVDVPDGWDGVLERCPVEQPRAFGDGFGAPRYTGGYHLHAGVDIISSYGAAIIAPFDGVARASSNGLGGLAVYVYGARGSVYNAHLSSYSSSSNGTVQAGDVIGYVGSTGDAGSINHDHFEFHPSSIPSSWPVSYYGYSVIGDAINPYPLLVQACG
jgi:murein DD-endopeptidase MepM/ murein hydrolase activator NlpD